MNIPIWPGSSSFDSGSGETPFGFYDNDIDFQSDIDKVTVFVTRRLGYPITETELQEINIYTCFEEAVTTYGNEVYLWKIENDYLSLESSPISTPLNNQLISPNMGMVIRISEQYGSEAGTGGKLEYYTGSISLTQSIQDYDLETWATTLGISSRDMEIKRIFFQENPAIIRFFDPYAGTGTGVQSLLESFGFGNFSPGINFLLMPISYDIQKLQAIELNDQVRKSSFSFELKNNKLKIFPIPIKDGTLHFEYVLKSERSQVITPTSGSVVTDISNVPYDNPSYATINSIGRSWIYRYTLALAKETLGYIRGKYQTVPIPGSETTLNHSDLLSSAKDEKDKLLENLREMLEKVSRKAQLEKRSLETDYLQKELSNVPLTIYVK